MSVFIKRKKTSNSSLANFKEEIPNSYFNLIRYYILKILIEFKIYPRIFDNLKKDFQSIEDKLYEIDSILFEENGL